MTDKDPAIYRQIADNIQAQIETGALQSGDRLQSERELSNELGVNRLTVRRAFNVLVERGLINRRHGGGTFVNEPRIERVAGHLVPFYVAIEKMGLKAGAQLVAFETLVADQSLAALLQLQAGVPINHLYRVRTVNDEPAMLEQMYFAEQLLPNFQQYDHENRSGYEIMETEYGVSVVRAEQSLEPVVATAYEAQLLGISEGDPLLLERRLAFDSENRPIEYGKDLYRGDKFRFVTTHADLALSYSRK